MDIVQDPAHRISAEFVKKISAQVIDEATPDEASMVDTLVDVYFSTGKAANIILPNASKDTPLAFAGEAMYY